jgi:hypothetical protein
MGGGDEAVRGGKGRMEVGVSVAGIGVAEGGTVGVNVVEGVGEGGIVGVGKTVGVGEAVKVGKGVATGVGDGPKAETVPPELINLTEVKLKVMKTPSKTKNMAPATAGHSHRGRVGFVSMGRGIAVV